MPRIWVCTELLLFFSGISTVPAGTLYPYGLYHYSLNQSYLTLTRQYAVYNGYAHQQMKQHFFVQPASDRRILHPPETVILIDETQRDFTKFESYELQGNLNIGKRINFAISIPYHLNTAYYKRVIELDGVSQVRDSLYRYSGLGRVSGLIAYTLSFDRGTKTHLVAPAFGGSLQKGAIVVGQYGMKLDQVLQPGTFSPDYFFRLRYTIEENESTLVFSMTHGWTQKRPLGFHPGNTEDISLNYLYKTRFKKLKIVPEGGLSFQSARPNELVGKEINASGGTRLMAGGGVGVNLEQLNFYVSFYRPLYENLSGNQLHNSGRLISHIAYVFNKPDKK